ncbi:MAG: PP2C family serine/threonine-protein phosphatase [Bacteroidota bacterium]
MKSYSYSHIGQKDNNEDSLGYSDQVFMVCDGVGGAVRGEMASKSIVDFVTNGYCELAMGEETILQVLDAAQDHLNELVNEQPVLDGMATTLAAIFKGSNGLFTAHAGDSRIYFVKPDTKMFWHTWDHSLVGSLVKNGEISHEEAARHPMNNQILKAFKGNIEGKKTAPEILFLSDLDAGDLAFICSDGVLEAFSHVELIHLLANTEKTAEEKLNLIKATCIKKSKDNHSAILLELEIEDCLNFSGYVSEWQLISTLN